MQLKVFLNSACDLKNVNWRYGNLQPYAVIWIDPGRKRSTKVDVNNGVNPVWDEMFTISVPPTSGPETAILYIDIVHVKPAADIKQLIGSTNLPLQVILDEALSKGKVAFSLILERPSGRPQGGVQIQIEINNPNLINHQKESCGQQARNILQQPRSKAQPRPRSVFNQHPNVAASVIPRHPTNSPQNLRPNLPQQPGNAMFMPSMIPQYRHFIQQPEAAFSRFILDSSKNQVGNMMMQSFQQMQQVGTSQGAQGNTGMVNDTRIVGNGTIETPDTCAGASVDGQFGTDGGFGSGGGGGVDLGVFGNGGTDMEMFGNSGLDLGGFDFSM